MWAASARYRVNAMSKAPPLDSLVDLACRDGVDIRPTLLRVLTDLYVQKAAHSAEEETQYVELALGLIGTVDAPTRHIVAARLAAYPDAPAAVMAKIERIAAGATAPTPPESAAEPTQNDLLEAFFAASAEERRLILTHFDAVMEPTARRPTPSANEVIHRLENAALQRNPGEFSRMLERAIGVDRALAERITRDESGEPIVVIARALGMTGAALQRILLFLNPAVGQSVSRVYELARLFDELTPAAADRMLSLWRKPGRRPQGVHSALHWNDERRDARSASTPARYRSDRHRIAQPTRVKNNER
jgi:hypothetical protein